ncbi:MULTISPECIES: M23 family metallopeptidase [unclassified Flavobacterium]|uniref:murein hydrolase activator EnvC family protein n=1 Tax=unclassified Flavobacterium TaxID=196869 RepID=UPI000869EDBE|nr:MULTISPECIES: M23 family metallopeptidase [unclassified Flavobacterium]MBN9285367.1 M23 family metallopeptidase [Flavobacterium sp.]ODS85460.1 MAG: peptidase M23 [Chryseobacterium sp. SCN 40-13]OJV71648.1 MAG: peptidase M23 [Flavobacterium sp. 40-81]
MSAKRLKRQLLKKKLFNKNRLVILNEDTFEEIFSLKLNLMNVFVSLTISTIFLITGTTFIIAFTPLREYIPGYSSTKLKREATQLAMKSDSLERAIRQNNLYVESIKKVLTGDLEYAKLNKDSIKVEQKDKVETVALNPSKTDLKLREQVALEDKYNVFEKAKPRVNLVLLPPVKGHIAEKYNAKNKHFFVSIALTKNTPIKSIANGTVVFADWTPTNGQVIIIRHNDGIISVYKRAASLTKSEGDVVKSGEVVALAGMTGIHPDVQLYFELWKDGYPIDPTQFIDFE